MKFQSLSYAWLLLLMPCLLWFFRWAMKRRLVLIHRFVSAELRERLLSGHRRQNFALRALLLSLAVMCLIVALMRPRYGFHWEEVDRRGVDILIALDVSQSMMAEDISPNRLARAKQKIIDLLDTIEGDRIGLMAFAGVSFVQCPLTLDYGAVRLFLDELTPDLIPVPGTAIADAIDKGVKAFRGDDRKARVMIIITDGEDTVGNPEAAAEAAHKAGVRIYTIGVGKEGGAPIPEPSGGFKKDSQGNVVMATLNEGALQKIALATGGSYIRSVTGNLDLENIYKDIRANVEDKELKSGKRQSFEERFQWPLALAIALLLAEVYVGTRRRKLPALGSRWKSVLPVWLAKALSLLMVILMGALSGAQPSEAKVVGAKALGAERAYKEGKFQEAQKLWLDAQIDDPTNEELKYNLANSYYKSGDFENAAKLYGALSESVTAQMRQQAFYNLGNSAYKLGKLEDALKAYDQALKINPNDEDAKANVNFVREEIRRRLEEQKKRESQQQSKQGDGQQQNNDEKKQQQDSQKSDSKPGQDQEEKSQKAQDGQQDKAEDKQQSKAGGQEGISPSSTPAAKPTGQEVKAEESPGPSPSPPQSATQDKAAESEEVAQKGSAQAQGAAKTDSAKARMTDEEAKRWLGTLKEDRSEYLKRKLEGQQRYRVEKDW